jgi:predicted nucleic acid-binding protein
MAQPIVIDANATLGLFLRLPYSQAIDFQMNIWQAEIASVIVPTLWEYECLSGIRRAISLKMISTEVASRIVDALFALEFERVTPSVELHRSALAWAERIGQSKIYDAHYLALAEQRLADFWTADKRLFHRLQNLGVEWANAFGD